MRRNAITSFRDLEVWQEAIALVLECYRLTENFPSSERYGLTAQLRRCATSIPANIAEGHGRKKPKPYLNHVLIALGSEAELATHIHVALELKLCSESDVIQVSKTREHVGRMLSALAESLERRIAANDDQ